jgi:16S rRNA (cytosine1402-N4)-methyltransferase
MHVPVMPEETLDQLAIRADGVYLDCTAGMGGHTSLIAARLSTGTVIANDRDVESLNLARTNTAEWKDRICFHLGTFGSLRDAVEQAGGRTAADLVNHTDEKTLADLIFQLGGERRARKIARAIVRARPLRSTLHLADVVERAVPRTGRIHPATKTFMALRIAVNDEPGELNKLLRIGPELVKSGGRMVVISFMSDDDRQVKEQFRSLAQEGRATLLTKRPLEPSYEETVRNPAARSAKLRAIEML